MAMNTEVIGWINRPGYRGVVVKENTKLMSLDFTKIIQLLDKVDKKIWEELCWHYGYIDRCTNLPEGQLNSGVERKVKQF